MCAGDYATACSRHQYYRFDILSSAILQYSSDISLPINLRLFNIAIFAVNVPGDSAAPGPMGNIFIGALLPVMKYENFISRNPNCGEPDNDGISTITVNGNPMGLAMNFRRFALLCPANARENLTKARKMLTQRKNAAAYGM